MSDEPLRVGDLLQLTRDIEDDGQDHHPPGVIGLKWQLVIVRRITHSDKGGERIYVSHPEITDNSFLVFPHEFKRPY